MRNKILWIICALEALAVVVLFIFLVVHSQKSRTAAPAQADGISVDAVSETALKETVFAVIPDTGTAESARDAALPSQTDASESDTALNSTDAALSSQADASEAGTALSSTDAALSSQADASESDTGEDSANAPETMASRNSLEGFFPGETLLPETEMSTEANEDTGEETQVQQLLEGMSLEEKIAQLFIVQPEALTGTGPVTAAGETTQSALNNYPVGGFIYMEQNLLNETQVKDMISAAQTFSYERTGLPLFISVDEEGGTVTRINRDNFNVPIIGDMADVGSGGDPAKARETGRQIGSYLSDLGFNLDFAPVADVWSNPENQVVARRSFGSDPQLTAQMCLEFLRGLQSENVYGTLKHFPGHGSTSGDTHDGYAVSDSTLEELTSCDLIPFIQGIEQGADFIMAGHISMPRITGDETPASLSGIIVTDLLRTQLQYDGIIITDAMNMGAIAQNYSASQAAVMALEAGVDMILMPSDFYGAYTGVLEAVQQQRISQERIDESLRRILSVKLSLMEQ